MNDTFYSNDYIRAVQEAARLGADIEERRFGGEEKDWKLNTRAGDEKFYWQHREYRVAPQRAKQTEEWDVIFAGGLFIIMKGPVLLAGDMLTVQRVPK